MKWCPQCQTQKVLSDFYANRAKSDGLTTQCKSCCKVNATSRRLEKPEVTRAEVRAARERNRNAYNAKRTGEAGRKYRAKIAEWARAYFMTYRKANRTRLTAYRAKVRAAQKRATPSWANSHYIALFYEMAKLERQRLGVHVEVDHIVPLQSPLVCGLHCEHNLQLLTRKANRSKCNRVWPDMPTNA